ncbi:hypothetical protein PIROE2DRAFT_61493 [Piromyces sp. E2]|nr:hypothetical protein PIROE2DRAFT_61493 [Piromyces sp. E2]|eukprot:OUM63060.1 hypothetical protein PIROE2DRAFT_61493 [Piromyces sp. E2]
MKFNSVLLIALSIGSSLAKDEFFGSTRRAKLFEKTDFVVPKITIHLSDEDYHNFFLKYQCERDMNLRYLKRNEDCYSAPWVDLDYAMGKIFRHNYIDKSTITDTNDLSIINKSNVTLSELEHIINKYSNFSLEKMLSTPYGLIKIPNYSVEEASLTFDLNGYVFT